jgi:hypothetical protein
LMKRLAGTTGAITMLATLGGVMITGCDSDGDGATDAADTSEDTTVEDTTVEDTTVEDTTVEDTTPQETACDSDAICANVEGKARCDLGAGICVDAPRGYQIGSGDGTVSTVDITSLVQWTSPFEATDLEFHPDRNELWVVNRPFEVLGTCSQSNFNSARCRSLPGFVTVIFEPGTPNQKAEIHEDGNAWHFMRRPPTMAMASDGTWATCGEAATGNFEDNSTQFIGPSLWSSDLSVFGPGPAGKNGSHLDMLHATPNCMGIAFEKDRVYWTFNGNVGAIDRYDFGEDHGPGNADHADGQVFRYAEGNFSRVANVPSHMAFNAADNHLYVADTGNGRVAKMDTRSGVSGGLFAPVYEDLAAYGELDNVVVKDVVPAGTLTQPSGLALHGDLLFVTDHATSKIHVFELDGTLVNTLDTGLPAGSLAGIEVGPDNKVYLSDMLTGEVYRVDPK